jgi:uncharacterized protein YqhQ
MLVPVAAVSFELIKFHRAPGETAACRALCWPGLMLQRLTTFEPDDEQLEVAIAALKGAVDK